MRTRALAVLAGLVGGFGIATGTPAVHAADTTVTLPLSAFRDIVVDNAHGHVFLTGVGSNGVVVRGLDGTAVTTITNQPGAAQMALSDDGSTLYVALSAGDAVSAISTTTLTESARYPTGASTCPTTVAVTGGEVWFGYTCSSGFGNLGVIDPTSDPTPTVTLAKLPPNTFYNAPGLQASADKPGLLVAGEFGMSPAKLRLIDVSSGSAVLGALNEPGSNLQDFAISADGAHVITASGYPYAHHSYSTTDLSSDGVYGTSNPYPNAVATAAGGLVAAGLNGSPSVTVYRSDGAKIRSYNWYSSTVGQGMSTSLPPAGLAFTPDGSRLFAVTTDYLGGAVQLHVLLDPGKFVSSMALGMVDNATINHPFPVYGQLSSSSPIPSGQLITIQRDSAYGSVNLPSKTTDSSGAFTFTDTVTKRGTYGYTATWAGNETHAGVTKRITFAVKGLTPSISITTGSGPYDYGARPLVVAHLSTTTSRTVSLYAQPYGGTKTLVKKGTVDSNGNLALAYTMTRRTTFTAAFAGDDTHEPTWVAKILTSRARLNTVLFGYYATSGSYRLYHRGAEPTVLVSVAPNNTGSYAYFTAQRYYSGAWHNATGTSKLTLDANSRAGAVLYTDYPSGTRYRLRATFLGSPRNIATNGSWVYLKLTT